MNDPIPSAMDTSSGQPSSANDGILPWYASAALAVGLCLVYCSFAYESFWLLPQRNPGRFIGYFLASLVLIPVAAAIGALPWLFSRRSQKQKVPFAPHFLGTLACIVALLYFGDAHIREFRKQEDAKQAAAHKATIVVSQEERKKVVLFDGSIQWRDSPGTDRRYMSAISGRIRNEAPKAILRISIGVAIRGSDGKVIETFEFSPRGVDRYSPLKPGHAISFEHPNYIDRLPKDMKWAWTVRDVLFESE